MRIVVNAVMVWSFLFYCVCRAEETNFPDPENRLQPDHAPAPFSAAEIRDSCRDGVSIKFRITQADGQEVYQITSFFNGTEASATMKGEMQDSSGNPLGEAQMQTVPWKDLQAHASFPDKLTTIEKKNHTTELGTFDCWVYTMTSEDKKQVYRYFFACNLPGPPVEMIKQEDGRQTVHLVMVAHSAMSKKMEKEKRQGK